MTGLAEQQQLTSKGMPEEPPNFATSIWPLVGLAWTWLLSLRAPLLQLVWPMGCVPWLFSCC